MSRRNKKIIHDMSLIIDILHFKYGGLIKMNIFKHNVIMYRDFESIPMKGTYHILGVFDASSGVILMSAKCSA